MNQNRILCRLRSAHAKWRCNFKKIKSAKNPILPQIVVLLRLNESDKCWEPFDQDVDSLANLSDFLESLQSDLMSGPGLETILDILSIIHRLWLDQNFRVRLPQGSLRSTIAKLSRYVLASHFLAREATQKSVFAKVLVETVTCEPLPQTKYTPSQDDLRSFCATFTSPNEMDLLYSRLSTEVGSSQIIDSAVSRRLGDLVSEKCAVHAEIKLLFYYEFLNPSIPPRVICSTKKACYLCNLFFVVHGRFHVLSTHGRLYEKWTIPKQVRDLKGNKAATFDKLLNTFFRAILDAIRCNLTHKTKKALVSNESLYLESFIWKQATDAQHQPARLLDVTSQYHAEVITALQENASYRANLIGPSYSSCTLQSATSPVAAAFYDATLQELVPGPLPGHRANLRLREGSSIRIDFADSARSLQIQTKNVQIFVSGDAQSASSAKSRNGPRLIVKNLNADQKMALRHESLKTITIDVDSLMPGVEVILEQWQGVDTTSGFYLSYLGELIYLQLRDSCTKQPPSAGS
jgi:hypothetical protein